MKAQSNPGAWFNFIDDEPEEGRVMLRVCTAKALKNIQKTTRREVVEYKTAPRTNRLQRISYQGFKKSHNDESENRLIFDYCIVDWEGIVEADGKTIVECTPENKARLMDEEPWFMSRVIECLKIMEEAEHKYQKDLEKN